MVKIFLAFSAIFLSTFALGKGGYGFEAYGLKQLDRALAEAKRSLGEGVGGYGKDNIIVTKDGLPDDGNQTDGHF